METDIDWNGFASKREALVLLPWEGGGTTLAWREGDKLFGCRDVAQESPSDTIHDEIVAAWIETAKNRNLPVEDRRK